MSSRKRVMMMPVRQLGGERCGNSLLILIDYSNVPFVSIIRLCSVRLSTLLILH